ncbi:MAG: rhamnogalacturonan acetylesterase [Vicinamibacteria bacterium]|nr:rhamnogalacturonan acetylesterase [Vicinamibacteria bacterium]
MSSLRTLVAPLLCTVLGACGGGSGATPTAVAPGTPGPGPAGRVTLHLAGDSTMGEGLPDRRPETGWGEELQPLFREDRLLVRNYARRGRSSRTFLSEGFWADLIANVKDGDHVIIQFGHNDGSIDEEQTPPAEYRSNFTRFVSEVRARRAFPILATPIVVRRFNADGTLQDTHGAYPDIVREVARSESAPLLDMQAISAAAVTEYGPEGSKELFQHLEPGQHPNYPGGLADNIHLSPTGALVLAQRAAKGLRDLNSPLAAYLR